MLADARIELDDDADLVLGRGSAVVEALAEGRAAYVYGDDGGDGWVTPERYELLEADGFSGRAEPRRDHLRAAARRARATTTRRSGRPAASWRRPTTRVSTHRSSSPPSTRSSRAATRSTRRCGSSPASCESRRRPPAAHRPTRGRPRAARTRATELERELAETRERNEQLTREVEELRRQADEAAALEEQRLERQKSRRFGPRR